MNWCSTCNEAAKFFCILCKKHFCGSCFHHHTLEHIFEPVQKDNSALVILDKEAQDMMFH